MHPHCAAGAYRRCPGYWGWHRTCLHRCVWFLFGAAAATLWCKHKERARGWEAWKNSQHGYCIRSQIKPLPWQQPLTEPSYVQEITRTINNIPLDDHGPCGFTSEEKKHMKTFGRRIENQSVDLCEAALDRIARIAESWKSKLSHYRAERKKQVKEEEEEEQSK